MRDAFHIKVEKWVASDVERDCRQGSGGRLPHSHREDVWGRLEGGRGRFQPLTE